MNEDLSVFGGKLMAYSVTGNPIWNFGWIPPSQRTPEQEEEHNKNISEMPKFQIVGDYNTDTDKAFLWQFSKQVNNGNHFLVFRQVTGSCIGNGLGQAIWYLSAVEASKGMPVEPKLPFYLLPYGRSRYYMQGGCGQGEGSFGSAAARAAREDGILPFDYPGLPQPNMDDGISWGSRAEMTWSDGCYPSREQLAEAKKFTVKSTAQVKSADDVKAALINGYPCTIASDWGGQMSPSTQGDPPVLLNRRVTTWINDVSPQSVMAV